MDWLNELVINYRKNQDLVDCFGLILYTEAHGNIRKVLSDEDYWSTFNEVTGKNWVVFSVRPRSGKYVLPNVDPGTFGLMHPIWSEPNENKSLLEMFDIKDTSKLPSFEVFSHDSENQILKTSMMLDDTSLEKAYTSIKRVLTISTNAIERISIDNMKYSEGVFRAVDMEISSHNEWQRIKKSLSFYDWVKGLLP